MKSFVVFCVFLVAGIYAAAKKTEMQHGQEKSPNKNIDSDLTKDNESIFEPTIEYQDQSDTTTNNLNVTLPPTQQEKATQIASECIKETGVSHEVLAEAKKGHITDDDEKFKKFTFCFFKKAGIVDADGKLNIETALAKLPAEADKDEAKKLLEACKSKTGKDTTDTVFEIFKCYHKDAKTHISLGGI